MNKLLEQIKYLKAEVFSINDSKKEYKLVVYGINNDLLLELTDELDSYFLSDRIFSITDILSFLMISTSYIHNKCVDINDKFKLEYTQILPYCIDIYIRKIGGSNYE